MEYIMNYVTAFLAGFMGVAFVVTMCAFVTSILMRLGHTIIKHINPEFARKIEF